MTFDLALYLGTWQKVKSVMDSIDNVFSKGTIHSGNEIIESIDPHVPHHLAIPIIHTLSNENVLHAERSDYSIGGYLFSLNQKVYRSYAETQLAAAKVIEEINSRTSERQPKIEFVATLPPSLLIGYDTDIGSIDYAIRRMIVSSKESVWIANPFFDEFGMEAIADSIVSKAESGVEVRLLTRGVFEETEGANIRPILKSLFDRFNESGSRELLSVRDFFKRDVSSGRVSYALHSKIVVVDRCICYLGSANVTQYGLRHNFEIGVVLRGEDIRPVSDLFEYVWRESSTVLPEKLR